jgi:hypothetical protein
MPHVDFAPIHSRPPVDSGGWNVETSAFAGGARVEGVFAAGGTAYQASVCAVPV